MDDAPRLAIPAPVLDYARFAANEYVPPKRTGGFSETSNQRRGRGDFLELVAKLTLKHFLVVEHNIMATLELTSGQGDDADMTLWVGDPRKRWYAMKVDVKSSEFAPFHEGLHLFVKAAEALHRPADIYIQCFVHLEESDDIEPHMHVAGLLFTRTDLWKEHLAEIAQIPGTGGANGVLVPCHKLRPVQNLLPICRPAWCQKHER